MPNLFLYLNKVTHLEYLRFQVDFSLLTENQYIQIFTFLFDKGLTPHLVFTLEDIKINNKYINFMRKVLQILGSKQNSKFIVELITNFSEGDWVSEYGRIYDFFTDEIHVGMCGLGGISVEYPNKMIESLTEVEPLKSRLDFLSLTLVPTVNPHSNYSLRETIVKKSLIETDVISIERDVKKIKRVFNDVPLFLLEFNLTARERDSINDHLFVADYYLAFMDHFEPLFDRIGYLYLLDDFSNRNIVEEFSGSPGLITHMGLCKPTLLVEEFCQLFPEKLLGKDENIKVGKIDWGSFVVLAYNYSTVGDYYSSDRKLDIYQHENYIF